MRVDKRLSYFMSQFKSKISGLCLNVPQWACWCGPSWGGRLKVCEELYGLISLAGSCLGPALITQLLLFVLPPTHKGSSYFLRFFQRPALKAVLHVATCNCLGPVRQVIKTIEKWPVAVLRFASQITSFSFVLTEILTLLFRPQKTFFFKQKCPRQNRLPTLYLYFRWSQHK